ncbi:MAG: DUF4214 domain-containing protein [Epsilonproteobacteria bacterium]|nr:DUF4214 domain-containing protein [Campylobacterota bacterium]
MNRIILICLIIFSSFSNIYALTPKDFIKELYEEILDRGASESEIDYWYSRIEEGKSAAYIIKSFLKSKEYRNKNDNDEEYIKSLYHVILEREPDEEGFEYWLSQMRENNIHRTQIFYKFLFSPEFSDLMENKYHITPYTKEDKLIAFIERFYNILFDRDAEYGGIEYWKNALLNGEKSAAEMANYFFFSEEFEEKDYDNEEFVKLAYRTLLDREADQGGLDFWVSLLDRGFDKRELIREFISSDEFLNLLNEYGLTERKGNGVPDFAKPIGEIKKIPETYGSWGEYETVKKSLKGNYGKDITIFYPKNAQKVPTIFFSPGWYDNQSVSYKKYEVLLNFIASKGYAVVFVPYSRSYELYKEVREGFIEAAIGYSGIIDTSKVGFLGFSSGGGVITSISYYLYEKYGWGEEGRFLFYLSPWYDFGMKEYADRGEYLLAHFPSNTKIIMQRYDRDEDDPRTLIDIYRHINIPNSEKDFILVRSSPNYPALHTIPYSPSYGADALDYYVIFRFIDALSRYTFFNDQEAKRVALGNGAREQVKLTQGLNDVEVTDYPERLLDIKPSDEYAYPCIRDINPRKDFCYDFIIE